MNQQINFIEKKSLSDSSKKFCRSSNNNFFKTPDECKIQKKTILQEFYSDECIFITGGTGFLGKILIEKLLRCCPDISRIYILVRSKRNKNIAMRINELLHNPIFEQLRKEMPEFSDKIIGISGDCSLPDLGLSIQDRELLISEVTIVFHAAATVRFDEELINATTINIQSICTISDICHSMQNLKSFVHISTAYANCFVPCIEEKFYNYTIKSEEFLSLVKSLSKDVMYKISPRLMKSWPNTYTFTKALAEDLIRTKGRNLPIGIFRPGIVISTAKEPIPGWIDNFYGPTGIVATIANGVIRALHCDADKIANIVPVDLTVNALIASAWDIATHVDRRNEEMLIYNFTSTVDAPISWGAFHKNIIEYVNKYPTNTALWYSVLKLNKHKLMYWLNIFLFHWIPATVIDFVVVSRGQKPRFRKMYQRMHKFAYVISHFCTNEWIFTNDNVQSLWQQLDSQDKQMFPFSMRNFDWQEYIDSYVKGIRIYLLKDDLNTLEASKIKWRRLYWMNQLLRILCIIFGFWFLWNILSRIFK